MEHMAAVSRVFVKRTRRGQVKTHVRQHYLRDDIPSGSPYIDSHSSAEPRLSASASTYLLPDTNVVLHQIDFLEHPSIRDVIILQTVLDEVRHNKPPIYKRLRAMVDDEARRFHVFCNEFHRETYISRDAGESPNDRNDRAIRIATKWYAVQLSGQCQVVLLTDDRENLRIAREDGIEAERVRSYVKALPNASELLEVLASEREADEGGEGGESGDVRGDGKKKREGQQRYEAHLGMAALQRGVAAGELHQGKLRVNRHNSSRGFVAVGSVPGHKEVCELSLAHTLAPFVCAILVLRVRADLLLQVLISDREAMNRATEGDMVVVRLLAEDRWLDPHNWLNGVPVLHLWWRGSGEERLGDRSTEDDLASAAAVDGATPFAANAETAAAQAIPL
ncbi:MAG: hypothetical protein SGPRY_013475 [Prymnesium sp.]